MMLEYHKTACFSQVTRKVHAGIFLQANHKQTQTICSHHWLYKKQMNIAVQHVKNRLSIGNAVKTSHIIDGKSEYFRRFPCPSVR